MESPFICRWSYMPEAIAMAHRSVLSTRPKGTTGLATAEEQRLSYMSRTALSLCGTSACLHELPPTALGSGNTQDCWAHAKAFLHFFPSAPADAPDPWRLCITHSFEARHKDSSSLNPGRGKELLGLWILTNSASSRKFISALEKPYRSSVLLKVF
uniref:Uncharacterized protein n=1 Tax=Mus musculus TaxID=10090 RepID=Q9D5B4_MOUSE|nr:unnamed protein product [Mus musculus]